MDRFAALLLMLTLSLTFLLVFLALFARSPIFSSLITALLYTLYLFVANEKVGKSLLITRARTYTHAIPLISHPL